MRVTIVAVGRLKSGPERDLISDYSERFRRTGRSLGFTDFRLVEIDERKATTKEAQAKALLEGIPNGSLVWACDERGDQLKSEQFARDLQKQAEAGILDLVFVIGGADGLGPAVLDGAHRKIAFGSMVWPHMLVRVLLTEQLYRAVSILAGLPYHRA
ncbi:MAG: 23S rRNA (pseudouridine(1915)-N(3))-methyltransferase RlmH [Pseudomonadota bacterium]